MSEPAPDKPTPSSERAAESAKTQDAPPHGPDVSTREPPVAPAKPKSVKAVPRPEARARPPEGSRPTPTPASTPAPAPAPVAKPAPPQRQTTKLAVVALAPSAAPDPKERIGRVLRERWRIDELVWSTPASALYWATHRAGTRAAIRVLSAELSADPRRRSAFFETAQIAQRIDHDVAVRVLDDDVCEDGAAFVVLELFNATPLADMLNAAPGPLDTDEALRIGDAILEVLAAAHTAGVHHGSLRAEDVFLTAQGRVRVLGFGGIDAGEPANFRRDTSAAGVLLHVMLTGEPPRGVALASRPPYCPERVSAPLAEVVDRALGVGGAEPWVDASAMAAAFRVALRDAFRDPRHDQPNASEAPPAGRPPPTRVEFSPTWLAGSDGGPAMNPLFFGEQALHRRTVAGHVGLRYGSPSSPQPAATRLRRSERTLLAIVIVAGLVGLVVALIVAVFVLGY